MIFQAGSLLLVIIGVYILKHLHVFGERDYKIVQGLMMEIPDNRKDRVELLKVIG